MNKIKKLKQWQQISLFTFFAIVVVLSFMWVTRDSRNTFGWEGDDGVVNIFPVAAESKNYRLKAYVKVDVTPEGFNGQKKIYDVDYVFWPNDGKTYFEECIVVPTHKENKCLDDEYREWKVEVQKEPNTPG